MCHIQELKQQIQKSNEKIKKLEEVNQKRKEKQVFSLVSLPKKRTVMPRDEDELSDPEMYGDDTLDLGIDLYGSKVCYFNNIFK